MVFKDGRGKEPGTALIHIPQELRLKAWSWWVLSSFSSRWPEMQRFGEGTTSHLVGPSCGKNDLDLESPGRDQTGPPPLQMSVGESYLLSW